MVSFNVDMLNVGKFYVILVLMLVWINCTNVVYVKLQVKCCQQGVIGLSLIHIVCQIWPTVASFIYHTINTFCSRNDK